MSLNVSELGFQNNLQEQKSALSSIGTFFSSELNLRTNEGDLVSLSFAGDQSLSESSAQKLTQENETVQELSVLARAAAAYSLTVQGDLNAEELAAIHKLAEEIVPLAKVFFANGQLNLEDSANVLANNLGVIQEIELALERTVVATFATRTINRFPEEVRDISNIGVLPNNASELDTDEIRNFPTLVQATLDAVFESEAEKVPEKGPILRSLNDLLSFIRKQLKEFFEYAPGLAESLKEPASGVVGDVSTSGGSEPPQLEQ